MIRGALASLSYAAGGAAGGLLAFVVPNVEPGMGAVLGAAVAFLVRVDRRLTRLEVLVERRK